MDLPIEIVVAAQNGDARTVFDWLGDPPIAKERINATSPAKMMRTLPHEAEFANNVEMMSVLLQYGADVDPKSSGGTTPLQQACSLKECDDASRLLLAWGAKTEAPRGEEHLVPRGKNPKLARFLQTPLGGRRCEIVDLVDRADLNGMTKIAYQYLPTKNRYAVVLERTNKHMTIKTENLKRRDQTPTDIGICCMLTKNENGQYGYQRCIVAEPEEEGRQLQQVQEARAHNIP